MNIQIYSRDLALFGLLLTPLSQTALAQGFEPCTATVDLRAAAAQGWSDTIRVTHQAAPPHGVVANNLTFRVVRPNGQIVGSFSESLDLGASVAYSIKQIYDKAGAIATLTPNLVQVVQNDGPPSGEFDMQGTYRNALNGQVVPLLFTCEELVD